MATPHKLTIIPYLQQWEPAARTLAIRVLVVPAGNPLEPLVAVPPGVPAFADAGLAFAVSISDTAGALPQRALVDQVTTLPDPASGPPTRHNPQARAAFAALQAALAIPDTPAADTFAPQDRDLTTQVRKYLPRSYRHAFAFVRPRTSLAVIDDSYHCLMTCPPEPEPPVAPAVIGWGEALAVAMRQPRLAEALGLVVPLTVPLDAAPRLERGGWLWVDLAPASDYAAEAAVPGFARSFATRVPELSPGSTRPVFTPVVFPVSSDAAAAATLGSYDKVFVEALRFDDGFSKVVHARQPLSADILDEDGTGPRIPRDEGVHLAWDDEDILEGQNRALGAPPDGEDPVLAPRGILGYRVDVRPEGAAAWTSLSRVSAPLQVGVDLGVAVEERWTEVAPTGHSGQVWLPAWFAAWRGGSLVVDTADERRLMDMASAAPTSVVPVDADAVPLRYGQRYEFRVRLVDTTGGGPAPTVDPVRTGEAPTALLHVLRHRPPGRVATQVATTPPDGRTTGVTVHRPVLGYPEAVFAAGAPARAALLTQIAANDAGPAADATAPSIPDPDATLLDVRVLLRAPAFDPGADEAAFVEWYRTTRRFPTDPAVPLELALAWHEAADYRDVDVSPQLGAEGAISGPVVVPTARDVRLELRALGRRDLAYFGSEKARLGMIAHVDLHAVAAQAAELDAVRTLPPAESLRSVFLRPDPVGARSEARTVVAQNEPSPVLLARLASALDLTCHGPMLLGEPGERVAFGCAGLTHHAAPDASSIELTDPAELSGQWINAVQLVLDRDWTWRGAGSPTLVVTRTVALPDANGAPVETADVGTIELINAINAQAAVRPDRSHTRLVFLDALAPRLGPDGLPYELEVTYRATLHLEAGGQLDRTATTRLPIVTPPAQVPRVAAAGIALTPYGRDADYAQTDSRTKRLWLEFVEPLRDARDAYFIRAMTSTPDPMLLPGTEPVADPVVLEATPLDPELVRVISPGQVQDLAGLSTMQRLEPSPSSDRHFLVPLPPDMDPRSPELFAFFTYEIRVGHDRGPAANPLWSTAQGRFGETLVLEGVQHPAPELPCSVVASSDGAIRARAPFATPYLNLRRVLPARPNTQIWVVLYARVVQADASTRRNIQLDLRRLRVPRGHLSEGTAPPVVEGQTAWSGSEVRDALDAAGLPLDLPISALAVEVLPEPNGGFDDPLGGDLGQVRILRTSPLTAVPRSCCW